VAKLRSKLRSLDNMKKDELQKRLEAKESECLEYRARLGTAIQPQTSSSSQFEPKTLPQLEGEAKQRISEFEKGFQEAHKKVLELVKEIGELKTTTRERTVVPR
jgi:predicted  nucleic acid-binding Zn-ribbon protein